MGCTILLKSILAGLRMPLASFWDLFWGLVLSSFLFKVLVAAIDTPFLYLAVGLFRKRFGLAINEEIS